MTAASIHRRAGDKTAGHQLAGHKHAGSASDWAQKFAGTCRMLRVVFGGWFATRPAGSGDVEPYYRAADAIARERHARRGDADAALLGYVPMMAGSMEQEERLARIAKLALLGEMATCMVHELSQPLAAIGIAAEILLEGAEESAPGRFACNADVSRRLRGIRQQVDRARGIIDSMCGFARHGGGDLAPVCLATAVAEALILAQPALQAETISLVVDIPPDLPPVRAIQQPLEQVIVNLLVNSRDAFRIGARRNDNAARAVRVAARCRGAGTIGLTAEDTAGGIDPAVLPHIFDPFFTTKPVGAGTGVGLSVSRAIVSRFGGTLTAGNTRHGVRFDMTLAEWTARAA